jgi:predicted DNA-binding transcriptional regulator YafY
MKASRLLSVLMLLQAQGRMSAPALAQALEVSVRTILRDIDELSAAGVPVWGERGRQGGFRLRPGWSTALTGLTEPESRALLLAGLPAAASDLGLGGPAASARLKLVASLPPEWRQPAGRIGERLHVDGVDWYRQPETPAQLQQVAQAVWDARLIEVHYESWRGGAERTLEPLGLVLKAGAWYLAARSAGQAQVRTWRLGKMDVRRIGRTFNRPPGFDLAAYWRESAARFEADLNRLQARIAASARALGWLENMRWRHQVLQQPAARAGWVQVQLPIESIEQGARRLLGWGAEVEVLAPAALRRRLRHELESLRQLYHGPAAPLA